MRRVAVFALLLVAISACSVPKAETLNCGEDQSIFACKAKFSDGKSRSIVFVKVPAPGQTVLDEVTTRDDLGNEYCVTLYQNVTATYLAGECGTQTEAASDPLQPTSTSLDPTAKAVGVACENGTSVFQCEAAYSDGSSRPVRFVEVVPSEFEKIDSDIHIDASGTRFCVTVYGRAEDSLATISAAADGC